MNAMLSGFDKEGEGRVESPVKYDKADESSKRVILGATILSAPGTCAASADVRRPAADVARVRSPLGVEDRPSGTCNRRATC